MGRSLKVTSERFSEILWIESTGSTNKDLLEAAQSGKPAGSVLVADHQSAGRGRQGRAWVDQPNSSLLFSVLLRPESAHMSVLPLVAGLSLVEALAAEAGISAVLKWPNDVLVVDESGVDRKLAGILAEATMTDDGMSVVVGCGINVAFVTGPPEGVRLQAIDMVTAARRAHTADVAIDRERLLVEILGRLDTWLSVLEGDGAPAIIEAYRPHCATLGRLVTLDTPTGEVSGEAVDLDPSGALIVEVDGSRQTIFAGDAHHR